MNVIRVTYDPEGDILYVTFGQPTAATGYQLSDQILLRVDPQTQKAAGLTILNFSLHAQAGREISLPGIEEVPELRSYLLCILTTPPVTHFLRIRKSNRGVNARLLDPSLQEALAG